MKNSENKLKYIYRDYVEREVSRGEVREAKQQLLRSYHQSREVAPLELPFILSVMVIGLVFLFCLYFKPVPAKPLQPVEVKRVASRVGPTMVYQKNYQDVPITIVWVFAGGNPA